MIQSPPKQEKTAMVHDCNQAETLHQLEVNTRMLSEIIIGNGDPEKGISRKVALIEERQGVIVEKLSLIHDDLNEYHEETKEAKEVALKVNSAFERYKAELEGVRRGRDEISTRGQVNFNNIISVISTIIIVAGLIYTIITTRKADEDLKSQIDNLSTPVIVNPTRVVKVLSPGDLLKFSRDGEFKSTTSNNDSSPD